MNHNQQRYIDSHCEIALELINRCEQDLCRVLSFGERKDLLADNTDWTLRHCDVIVLELKERGLI